METCTIEPRPESDLELRLSRRREAEALHHKGRWAHGRGDFLLRHHRVVGPVLRATLRASGLYARGVRNACSPEIRHVRFTFPTLPPAFHGFRILHLSDLHIDGLPQLAGIVANRLADLPVDVCVMTGDYRYEVEGPCDAVYPLMETIVRSVRAPQGIIGILGNHDAAEIAVGLEALGVRMLINEAVEVGNGNSGVWVVGVDDPHYYGGDDLAAALQCAPRGAFKILLAHTPELFAEAAAADIDLYLCGHTHAGQIALPYIGPLLLNAKCPRAYTRGAWQHGRIQGYTSAGLGASMVTARFGCPPEITVIELAKAGRPAVLR